MRNAFADEVTRLAALDPRLVLLSGDIGNKLFDGVKAVRAEAFLNCGIAEANMIGVAAGLAMSGLRPIVYTIAPFTTTRCLEQIRVDACYHRAPVTIVGTGAGLSYAELGPTHHSLEDLAILRALPDMKVVAPCDAYELRQALVAALNQEGPVYIRIGKKGEPDIHLDAPAFRLGRAIPVLQGTDVALLATGTIMPEVLVAAGILQAQGISAEVVSFHTVKPLDEAYLGRAVERFRLLVTIEEHGRIGGFGSAVAEWRAINDSRAPQLLIGTPDEFMHEVGDQAYARLRFGLAGAQIAQKVLDRLRN